MRAHGSSPHARGVGFALAAALAFGLATPLISHLGEGLGPFTTAACLYAGAAVLALLVRPLGRGTGHPLRRSDRTRVLAMAVLGATVAPALLAYGLRATSATSASLILNLEAVFTLLLAALVYREPIGWRAALAAAVMLAGGTLLVARGGDIGAAGVGLVAVVAATAVWGVDNTLSRPLAEAEPMAVVTEKAAVGATLSIVAALLLGEPAPPVVRVLALMAVGAVGYGASLALYLTAQRHLGAGRTGSVFSLGPFIGALVAIAWGDRDVGWTTALAATLFALGVWLHLGERHGHRHVHHALEHEHFHRHDDGHHDHDHASAAPSRGHSHWHRHEPVEHDHPHAPDLHHLHEHPRA